jgi:hypothetical protein
MLATDPILVLLTEIRDLLKAQALPKVRAPRLTQASDRADGFAAFWLAYPVKGRVGRGAAEKAWATIKPDTALQQRMLLAIAQQKRSERWQNGYIPNAATWLNQKRWEDAVVVAKGLPPMPTVQVQRLAEQAPDTATREALSKVLGKDFAV